MLWLGVVEVTHLTCLHLLHRSNRIYPTCRILIKNLLLELEDGRLRAAPAKLLSRGPANKDVRGLLKRFSIAEPDDGAFVVGRAGLGVLGELDEVPLLLPLPAGASSRVFESQQTAPFSHKLGGSLMTTEGLEQNADMRPGKQTPGHRLGAAVVVVPGAFVVVAMEVDEAVSAVRSEEVVVDAAAGRGVD